MFDTIQFGNLSTKMCSKDFEKETTEKKKPDLNLWLILG